MYITSIVFQGSCVSRRDDNSCSNNDRRRSFRVGLVLFCFVPFRVVSFFIALARAEQQQLPPPRVLSVFFFSFLLFFLYVRVVRKVVTWSSRFTGPASCISYFYSFYFSFCLASTFFYFLLPSFILTSFHSLFFFFVTFKKRKKKKKGWLLRHPLWPVIRRKVPFFPNVSPPCHPPPTNAGPGSRNRISVRVESWLLHTHTWFRVFFFLLLLLYCSLAVQQQQQRSLQPHSHSGWVVRRISFFSYELRFLPFFFNGRIEGE